MARTAAAVDRRQCSTTSRACPTLPWTHAATLTPGGPRCRGRRPWGAPRAPRARAEAAATGVGHPSPRRRRQRRRDPPHPPAHRGARQRAASLNSLLKRGAALHAGRGHPAAQRARRGRRPRALDGAHRGRPARRLRRARRALEPLPRVAGPGAADSCRGRRRSPLVRRRRCVPSAQLRLRRRAPRSCAAAVPGRSRDPVPQRLPARGARGAPRAGIRRERSARHVQHRIGRARAGRRRTVPQARRPAGTAPD